MRVVWRYSVYLFVHLFLFFSLSFILNCVSVSAFVVRNMAVFDEIECLLLRIRIINLTFVLRLSILAVNHLSKQKFKKCFFQSAHL